MNFREFFEEISGGLEAWFFKITHLLPNIIVALLLFLLFIYLAKYTSRLIHRLLSRFSHNINVNRILSGTIQVALVAIGLFIALSVLHLDKALSSLLAGAGIIGIALSFAFQDVAANFMSGIIIAVRRPFTVGELVQTKEYFGRIESISMRTTKLISLSGQLVIIPNRDILQNPLINYNYTGHRRVELRMRVGMHEDLAKAREVTLGALKGIPFLEEDKELEFFYTDYDENSIRYLVRFWITAYFQKDYLMAKSQAIMNIQQAYAAAGITIPLPPQILQWKQEEAESPEDKNKGPLMG